jgi:thiol:disulfide interchange protein
MLKPKWIIILLLSAWMIVNAFPMTSMSSQKGIDWQPYSTGMSSAQENNKTVFLHFYASWCSYCTKMDKESFHNDSVVDLLKEKFISIRVDVDKQPKIAQEYNVYALPTTYFFTSKGEKLGPVPGYITRDRLLEMLNKV